MLYPVILFIMSGLLGTFIALRLMAIDAQEQRTSLTRRGRIVVALLIGIVLAILVIAINGMWWDCDLRPAGDHCSFTWGY